MVHYLGDQQSRDYHYSLAVIKSPQATTDIDVVNIIAELEIYEHIDKPYLTGQLVLIDNNGLFDGYNFQGGEIFELEISRSIEAEIKAVKKSFVIDHIVNANKPNESVEVMTFHLIEDIAFTSNLKNVNRTFEGQPSEIIKAVADEFLNKDVISTEEDNVQNAIKVNVPNMTPLETIIWIKNRAASKNGFPFYIYSAFGTDELYFKDLENVIETQPVNVGNPFVYLMQEGDATTRLFKIHDYKYRNAEDITRMLRNAVVGATHNFYNTYNMTFESFKFNVHDDLFEEVMTKNKQQTLPNLSRQMSWEGVPLSEYNSKNFSFLTNGEAFEKIKSYEQEDNASQYKKRIVAQAVKNFMTKQPLEITVDGREFLHGEYNFTVGNNIRLLFKPNFDPGETTVKIDSKKSGDYTVFASRHVFQQDKYFVKLLCGKLANYKSNEVIT